jgi:hypothetical protein
VAVHNKRGKKIDPQQIRSYRAFKNEFGIQHESDTRVFTKFYAARLLINEGHKDVYVNPRLSFQFQDGAAKRMVVDVCAEHNGRLIAVFCVTESLTVQLFEKLRLLSQTKNVETIIICPHIVDIKELKMLFIDYFNSGKFSIRPMTWINSELENVFKEAIGLVSLLGNYTRMKMLLPLLTHSRRKRHYRRHINPKLIYENLTTLMERKLIDERTHDEYALTSVGREVLSEYLTFLENIKKIIETADKEVK